MPDGFFSRWSRRKEAVREGRPVESEPVEDRPAAEPARPEVADELAPSPTVAADALPPPTLEDVQSLTAESDFSRFVRPDVSPDVKNAALRKLFSDPHFNEMDGLDTYIDDYSQPDPLPASMLKQLASANFLKLAENEESEESEAQDAADASAARPGREVADDPTPQSVAQSPQDAPAVKAHDDHADPDLRLQQDDAPGPDGPGERTR